VHRSADAECSFRVVASVCMPLPEVPAQDDERKRTATVLHFDEGESGAGANRAPTDGSLSSFALASSVSADPPACLGSGHAQARPISDDGCVAPPASERLDIENSGTAPNRPTQQRGR
jgi:hypothetical protein